MALRVPEPDEMAAGAGQPTQGTRAGGEKRRPWVPNRIHLPIQKEDQQPEHAPKGGAGTGLPSYPASEEA
jgi:hypothetical protein